MESSVDLSGITWSMAVIPWFNGTFAGNSYVISNLHIQGGQYLGLFGRLDSRAKVFDLGLEAININGSGDDVGGLVGNNKGSIATSYCTGTVTGGILSFFGGVGGLVGFNVGQITASYSTDTVTGDGAVGGLAGVNDGSITKSYSSGAVTGYFGVGGLVGENWEGNVNKSYSTGTVNGDSAAGGLVGVNYDGNINSSFWDVETSGFSISGGGSGKTTAQMQTAGTFLEAGWDLVGETENGTEDIWWIDEGVDYPHLWWEASD
jgi:hypothetical protein